MEQENEQLLNSSEYIDDEPDYYEEDLSDYEEYDDYDDGLFCFDTIGALSRTLSWDFDVGDVWSDRII